MFTNGEALNAQAVQNAGGIISKGETGWGNINNLLSVIESVEAVDEYTVRINTIKPFGNLLPRFTMFLLFFLIILKKWTQTP